MIKKLEILTNPPVHQDIVGPNCLNCGLKSPYLYGGDFQEYFITLFIKNQCLEKKLRF